MTTPTERTRAVLLMGQQAERIGLLVRPGDSARVLVSREELRLLVACLRHYPGAFDMLCASERAPDLFGRPSE